MVLLLTNDLYILFIMKKLALDLCNNNVKIKVLCMICCFLCQVSVEVILYLMNLKLIFDGFIAENDVELAFNPC